MKIYIQSKSGDFNATFENSKILNLFRALEHLRKNGGYFAEFRHKKLFVPFEEIQYIAEAE